jgi:hypothetical protein
MVREKGSLADDTRGVDMRWITAEKYIRKLGKWK